jgi:signal transduction histidine kinase
MRNPVKRTDRKPSFFWQGVLILVPVLVLAALGANALLHDKLSVEREAKARAEEIADRATQLLFTELTNPASAEVSFAVDRNGRLVSPLPYDSSPEAAPLDLSALTSAQRNLWLDATREELSGTNRHRAIQLYDDLIRTVLPPRIRTHALFARGLLLQAEGKAGLARTNFTEVMASRETIGETGVDLRALAAIKLTANSPDTFASNVVARPTALTPRFLREATVSVHSNAAASSAVAKWRDTWERDELARALYGKLRPMFRTNAQPFEPPMALSFPVPRAIDPPVIGFAELHRTNFHLETNRITLPAGRVRREERDPTVVLERPTPLTIVDTNREAEWATVSPARERAFVGGLTVRYDERWFITRTVSGETWRMLGRTEVAARQIAERVTRSMSLPRYFDLSVRLGGHELISSNSLEGLEYVGGGKGAGNYWKRTTVTNPPPVLALATRGDGTEPALAVAVHLLSRGYLFEEQRARALFFTLVLAAAILASLIGFAGAYRAFLKQVRLSELKSNFVSSVSHELRAPIASVRLMAEGLERGKVSEPAKQHEYFRFITQECRRLSSMIENVLDFARIEQGRKQYEFEPTDVVALVEQTVKLMEPYASERGVRLRVENLQSSTFNLQPTIDGQAIQQALVNLIDNAIKHSPSGTEVAVSLNSQPSTLNIRVSDHGPGIPATEHVKIFERFYRLGSELRRETPGVGIGLSIVKHVVEAHRGTVRVDSEVGKGSCFTIELPLNVSPASCREEAVGHQSSLSTTSRAEATQASSRQDAGGTL